MCDVKGVEAFLRDFREKLKFWGVLFIDRPKNGQALADLEIIPQKREDILMKLKVEDYCEGPLEETQYGSGEMWVFGKVFKDKEIYIKISLGMSGAKVLCISFHIAEYPMNYKIR